MNVYKELKGMQNIFACGLWSRLEPSGRCKGLEEIADVNDVLNDNDNDVDNIALKSELEPEIAPIFTRNVRVNICVVALAFIYCMYCIATPFVYSVVFFKVKTTSNASLANFLNQVASTSSTPTKRDVNSTHGSEIYRYLRLPQIPVFDLAEKDRDILD